MAEQINNVIDNALMEEYIKAWQGFKLSKSTPHEISTILEKASKMDGDPDRYLSSAEELEEIDGHYRGLLQVRKNAVASIEYIITAPKRMEGVAKEIQSFLIDSNLRKLISNLMDAVGKGYAVVEPEYISGPRIYPARFNYVMPQWLRYSYTLGRFQMRVPGGEQDEFQDIPPHSLVIHELRDKSGAPIRNGCAKTCMFWSLGKRMAYKNWCMNTNGHSKHYTYVKVPAASVDETKARADMLKAYSAISRMNSIGAIALPSNYDVGLLSPSANSASEGYFMNLMEFSNREMSKAVLGQVGTSDGGQGNSKQTEMGKVLKDIIESDSKNICETVNEQIVVPYVDMNYGPQQEYPKIEPVNEDSEEMAEFIERVTPLVDRGFKIPTDWIYRALKIARPAEGEEVLLPLKNGALFGNAD